MMTNTNKATCSVGSKVRVAVGPYSGCTGTVSALDDNGAAIVDLDDCFTLFIMTSALVEVVS